MRIHRRAASLARAVYREVRAERLTFMAGSIAYHAFVSLVPFMLVVLLLVASVRDQATAVDVMAAIGAYLSPSTDGLLTRTVRTASERTSLSVFGGVVLLWGAVKIFRSLDAAFSSIYDLDHRKSLFDSVRDAVVALLAVGAGLVVAGLIGSAVSFDGGPLGTVFGRVVSVVSVGIVLFPLYYLFPDENVTAREVVPGTAFAAVGWTVLELLFRYYVAVASVGERYGVVGTILLLITWLYFSGFVLLVGAALNAVLAGRSADVAELGWGENAEAKDRSAFARPLETIDEALAAGESLTVRIDGEEVLLPPPAEYESSVAAPDRPAALGAEEVEGHLDLTWVHGRDVGGDEG